jgi:hypothetical protein
MCLYYRFFWSLLVPIPATLAVVTGQNTAEHDRTTTCFAPAIVTTPTDITVPAPYKPHLTAAVAIFAVSHFVVQFNILT